MTGPLAAPGALAALYASHGHMVLRRARALLHNEAEAQDVTQEVFASLVQRPEQFEGRSAPSTFLYAATTHLALRRMRDRNHRAHLVELFVAPGRRDAHASPEGETLAVLRDVLGRVPAELAVVATYIYLDEMMRCRHCWAAHAEPLATCCSAFTTRCAPCCEKPHPWCVQHRPGAVMTTHSSLGLATSGRCCSDLLLDRYLVGDMVDDERLSLATHLDGSPRCQSRLQLLREDRHLFQQGAVPLPVKVAPPRRWSRTLIAAPVLMAAAAVAIVTIRVDDGIRTKGAGLSLAVHVARAGVAIADVDSLHPNDVVQFTAHSQGGHAAVISMDAARQASAYAPPSGLTVFINAGDQLLPHATQLDDTVGREQLHLYVCEQPHDVADLVAAVQANHVAMRGCTVTTTTITKEAIQP